MGILYPSPFLIGVLLSQIASLNSGSFYAHLLKDVCPQTLGGIVPPCYLNLRSYAPYVLETLPPYILEYLLGVLWTIIGILCPTTTTIIPVGGLVPL